VTLSHVIAPGRRLARTWRSGLVAITRAFGRSIAGVSGRPIAGLWVLVALLLSLLVFGGVLYAPVALILGLVLALRPRSAVALGSSVVLGALVAVFGLSNVLGALATDAPSHLLTSALFAFLGAAIAATS
jgi:hypothetical protein